MDKDIKIDELKSGDDFGIDLGVSEEVITPQEDMENPEVCDACQ